MLDVPKSRGKKLKVHITEPWYVWVVTIELTIRLVFVLQCLNTPQQHARGQNPAVQERAQRGGPALWPQPYA